MAFNTPEEYKNAVKQTLIDYLTKNKKNLDANTAERVLNTATVKEALQAADYRSFNPASTGIKRALTVWQKVKEAKTVQAIDDIITQIPSTSGNKLRTLLGFLSGQTHHAIPNNTLHNAVTAVAKQSGPKLVGIGGITGGYTTPGEPFTFAQVIETAKQTLSPQ